MKQQTAKQRSAEKLLLVVAVVAIIAGAAIGVTVGYAVRYEAPTTRAFYLFNNSLPFNEHTWGIPHDTFSPDRITVNKGDHVVIYYRNIEDTTENHTFDMDQPYTFDAVIHAGQNETFPVASTVKGASSILLHVNQTATIAFTASWAGVFPYRCSIHQPTMTGYLVVLG
jgi:plastocyanin